MDNLKLLVDPVYTAKRLSRCATARTMELVTTKWLNQGKNRFAYWIVPDDTSFFENDLKVFSDKRIVQIPVPLNRDRYREMWFPSNRHVDLFREWGGAYGDWDVVITTRNTGLYFRKLFMPTVVLHKFLVLAEPFPILEFKGTFRVIGGPIDRIAYAMHTISGYVGYDKVFIQADFEKAGIIAQSREILSASLVRDLDKKIEVAWSKSDVDFEPTSPAVTKTFLKGSPFKIFYIQRLQIGQRRFDLVHKLLSVVYSRLVPVLKDIEINVCTNSALLKPRKVWRDMKFMQLKTPNRAELFELLKGSHVFVSFSIEEGTPKGLSEATQLGVIGVATRCGWSESFFGKDYFGLGNEMHEVLAIIKWIYHNRAEARKKWCEWYTNYFCPKVLDRGNLADRFCQVSDEYFQHVNASLKEDVSAAGDINKLLEKAKMKRVDVLCLKGIPGVTIQKDVRTDTHMLDATYFKLPFRWRMHYQLRRLYGWQSSQEPWILTKP